MNRREAPRRRLAPRWRWVAALGILAIATGTTAWSLIDRARRASEARHVRRIGAKLPALPLEQLIGGPPVEAGRRGWVRGRYDRDRTQLLDADRDELPGARVVTPLFVDPGEEWALLVDRGWIPSEEFRGFRERDGAAAPRVLYGTLEPLEGPREALRERLPYPVLEVVLVREPGNGDELPLPDPVSAEFASRLPR